jgi:hypothetical protein
MRFAKELDMRGIETAYEIRIDIPRETNIAEKAPFSKFAHKTFGIKANSLKQAENKGEKLAKKHNGHVASVRKSEIETIYDVKNIHLLEPLASPVTHSNVIKMDEFVWLKRTKRIDNQNKDKKDIDNKEIN